MPADLVANAALLQVIATSYLLFSCVSHVLSCSPWCMKMQQLDAGHLIPRCLVDRLRCIHCIISGWHPLGHGNGLRYEFSFYAAFPSTPKSRTCYLHLHTANAPCCVYLTTTPSDICSGSAGAQTNNDRYLWSVTPCLMAWPAIIMQPGPASLVVGSVLGVCYVVDRSFTKRGLLPPWCVLCCYAKLCSDFMRASG